MNFLAAGRATPGSISAAAAILVTIGFIGCDASRPAELVPPEPGQLIIQFQTPTEAEGALRVRLEGPGIGTITAAQNGALVLSRAKGARREIVVLGTLTSGPLLRFEVPDVNRLHEYDAVIMEVADVANLLRSDPSEYAVQILP